ncbi:MAG: AraC family transcriptional regulator [Oscillospiraceae bacterium]|nr:AraC family transcriptional regulator [Oscillospiraceae bacterium]
MLPGGSYLSMEYGPTRRLPCNVHRSAGTPGAMRLHYHDFYQIYFLLRGELIHSTETASVTLYRGDCFIVPPFFSHRIDRGKAAPQFFSFSFRPDFLPDVLADDDTVRQLFASLTPGTLLPKITPGPAVLRRLEELMTLALREFEVQEPGFLCALQGLLAPILVLLSRAYLPRQDAGSCASFHSCLSYLDTHFREDLTLPQAAAMAYLSPAAFCRTFRAATGRTFHQYLAFRRIDYACGLLRQTETSVAAIAALCGYRDFSAFSRAFKKETGVTPLRYRRAKKL